MGDKPILFSAPMIRALMGGRKTQTRRVLKPQPVPCLSWDDPPAGTYPSAAGWSRYPYAPGDRLWVREAFSYETLDVDRNGFLPPWYWADGNPTSGDFTRPKPSIHMPRWASRLTLTVTDVRVQQLQKISGEDCIAEGVSCETCAASWSVGRSACNQRGCFENRQNFRTLWNSLHGPDAWAANPWVVALTFDVHRCNIDQMPGASHG
jgi:hypothetical protein